MLTIMVVTFRFEIKNKSRDLNRGFEWNL